MAPAAPLSAPPAPAPGPGPAPGPATAVRTVDHFLDGARLSISYATMLVKDIPPAQFAHMPHPQMNHPAFCIGHLSLYGDRLLRLIGREELVRERPRYLELFKYGTPCVEQDGRYPPKDEIVAYYLERYDAAMTALPGFEPGLLSRPADESARARFPTVGSQINFLLNNHQMVHLGQVSAWRRAVGLGPAL